MVLAMLAMIESHADGDGDSKHDEGGGADTMIDFLHARRHDDDYDGHEEDGWHEYINQLEGTKWLESGIGLKGTTSEYRFSIDSLRCGLRSNDQTLMCMVDSKTLELINHGETAQFG